MRIFTLPHILLLILCFIYTNFNTKASNNTNNKINNNKYLKNNLVKLQGKKSTILIYNQVGELKCKLISNYIQYFDNIKTTYIIQPTAILFNKTNHPTWNINATQAKITHNKIMYLHGNIQIINLIKESYLQSITTNAAILNLITYDIFSNEKINIHGTSFHTLAKNLRGNLKTKNIELSKIIYTLYETKKSKKE